MKVLIIFFACFIVIKISFFAFLFYKTYSLLHVFRQNLKTIEVLNVTKIKNDLGVLSALKQNLKYFLKKKDFIYFVKKSEEIGSKFFKHSSKTLKNYNRENTVNVNDLPVSDNNSGKLNAVSDNRRLIYSQTSDRRIISEIDKMRLNIYDNKKSIIGINKVSVNAYENAGNNEDVKEVMKKKFTSKKEDKVIYLDMGTLTNNNNLTSSIYISLLINVLYYIIFLIVNWKLYQGFHSSAKFAVLSLKQSLSVYNYLMIVSDSFLKPTSLNNTFDNSIYNNYYNLSYQLEDFKISTLKNELFSYIDYPKFSNLSKTYLSAFKEKFTIERPNNNKRQLSINDNNNIKVYRNLQSQLLNTEEAFVKVYSDLFDDFTNAYLNVFEVDVLQEYNDLYQYINKLYLNETINKNLTALFNLLSDHLNEKVFEKFNVFINLYDFIRKKKINYFQDVLNTYINTMVILSVFFYLIIIFIDVFTVFSSLLVKIKINFGLIKNMNDLICSIA